MSRRLKYSVVSYLLFGSMAFAVSYMRIYQIPGATEEPFVTGIPLFDWPIWKRIAFAAVSGSIPTLGLMFLWVIMTAPPYLQPGSEIELPPGTSASGQRCFHLNESSTYCTKCWMNLFEARRQACPEAEGGT